MSFDSHAFGSGSTSGLDASSGVDPELQEFLAIESQKAKFQAQIHQFTDVCWDKCVDKAGSKLDSRTETCLSNCVERFIDTTFTVTQRFQQLLERQQANM